MAKENQLVYLDKKATITVCVNSYTNRIWKAMIDYGEGK